MNGRSGGVGKKTLKSKTSTRPTVKNGRIEFKGASRALAHRIQEVGEKKTAARDGLPNGGKSDGKARKNLQRRDYLALRVDATAFRTDPHLVDLDELDRLIALADATLPDADEEPSLGAVAYLDQSRWASHGSDDREWECEDEGACADHQDRFVNPPHLDGGNGQVSAALREARI